MGFWGLLAFKLRSEMQILLALVHSDMQDSLLRFGGPEIFVNLEMNRLDRCLGFLDDEVSLTLEHDIAFAKTIHEPKIKGLEWDE